MTNKKIMAIVMALALLMAAIVGCAGNKQEGEQNQQQSSQLENRDIILATTTSTQDSGLLDVLIPMFQEKTGYIVKTVAVGTGMALEMGEQGNADVLLVHAPAAEKPLVDSGVAINYELVMHNDFVLLGPPEDPAGVKGNSDIVAVLNQIADKEALFISRGDDSGTHKKELDVWKTAGVDPQGQSWYQETGQGMGASITVANDKLAYILSDRATYLAQSKNIDLEILSEGAEDLKNIYHVMQVNPDKFDKINGEGGKAFVNFMIDNQIQQTINEFGVDQFGQSLFFADRL